MSVKVNEVVGVAGFVVPGTRVDVLVTIRQDRDSVTHVVASNVQVLTAGARYNESETKKDGKPIPSTVVTLMVTPADAERIALATHEGQIMLALRNPLDLDRVDTPGVRTAALVTGSMPQEKPPAPAPPPVRRAAARPAAAPPVVVAPPAAQHTVETIKAGKRDQEIVR
jgi:pilus assembly protein CpaB